MHRTRIAASFIAGGLLIAALLAGTPGEAFAQGPPKPPDQLGAELENGLTKLMFSIEDLGQEVEALNILSSYCKPPDAPLKVLTQQDLDYYRLRVRILQSQLEGHKNRFDKSVAAMTGAARINYVASFPEIRSTRPDATDERQNSAYWAAARRVLGEVTDIIERKQRQLNAAPEVNCRPRGKTPNPQPESSADDLLGGLRPPRFTPINPPGAEECYEDSDARRRAYNAAYDVEQAANANVNHADSWTRHLSDLRVLQDRQDAAPEVLQRLDKMIEEARAASRARRAEWDAAYAVLRAIAAAQVPCPKPPPPPPAPPPPPPPTEKPLPLPPPPSQRPDVTAPGKVKYVLFGGFKFGAAVKGEVTPLPAPELRPAPENRFYYIVPSWFIDPGRASMNEVLKAAQKAVFLLDNGWEREAHELGLQAYGLLYGFRLIVHRPGRSLMMPGRMGKLSARAYVEGAIEPLGGLDLHKGEFRAAADRVHVAWRDGLLNNPEANPSTLLAVTSSGGYLGKVKAGGGVEVGIGRRFAGFETSVWGGVAVLLPVGTPKKTMYRLRYGFTSGSGVTFQQTDAATLQAKRNASYGFDGGVTLTKPIGRRLVRLDVGVGLQQLRGRVLLTAEPTTESSGPSVLSFVTPPGGPTIVISGVPAVPSSLGGGVSDFEIWRAKGWSLAPMVRFGVMF